MRLRPSPIVAAARRALLAFGLLGVAPALAGPGATLAAVALLSEDGHAHHVSVQRDAGHDDIVICHDAVAIAAPVGAALSRDCQDPGDHRLHITHADRLKPRSDAKSDLRPVLVAALVATACESFAMRGSVNTAPVVASFGPPPLSRTGILLL